MSFISPRAHLNKISAFEHIRDGKNLYTAEIIKLLSQLTHMPSVVIMPAVFNFACQLWLNIVGSRLDPEMTLEATESCLKRSESLGHDLQSQLR